MQTRLDVDNTAADVLEVASTKFGKPIKITRGGFGRLYKIEVGGGGIHPPGLSGMFTEYAHAFQAVERYVGLDKMPEHPKHLDAKRKKVKMEPSFTAPEVPAKPTEPATQE